METDWCPMSEGWVEKMWPRHTTEHGSATRKERILLLATTGMDLENMLPRELRQAEQAQNCVMSLTRGTEH